MWGAVIEIVVGDVHARAGALRALLRRLGALDSRGRRRAGFWIVQVGDLLDRRASPEANLDTARLAARALDVSLAGNHEVGMLAEADCPQGAALATLAVRGWPQAAVSLDDWLVTHAGVHPELARVLPGRADECAAEINDRWHRRPQAGPGDPLFDWVGPARGGLAPHGGLIWLDAGEWPRRGRTPWGQITGHCPQTRPRLLQGPRWAIDVGSRDGRLAALVRRHRSGSWDPLVVRSSTRLAGAPAGRKRLAGAAA